MESDDIADQEVPMENVMEEKEVHMIESVILPTIQPQEPTTPIIVLNSTSNTDMDLNGNEGAPEPPQPLNKESEPSPCRCIAQKDQYDLKAWDAIFAEVVQRGIRPTRQAYNAFFRLFPTAGSYWKAYAEFEIAHNQYEEAEAIFQKNLIKCVHVEFFRTYLDYLQNIKLKKMEDLSNTSKTVAMVSAYEFALGQIGLDITSSYIWISYIDFLRSEPNPNIDAIRDVFKRALVNPMHNLETIWAKFTDFERWAESPKHLELLQRTYDETRKFYRVRKSYIEGIYKNILPPPRIQLKELHQVRLWKKWIEYEKQNLQILDQEQLERMVNFTFNQAIACLYHYPEIWHMAAQYQIENHHLQKAKEVYERACRALPNNLLLHLQCCDFLELNNMAKEASAVYENLLDRKPDNMLIWIHHMYHCRRTQGIQAARNVFFKARKLAQCTYHIYVAAAQIEFYINKDEHVAMNIFELGYSYFSLNTDFLQHYVDFLFHRNEESYMRVLLEKILSTLAPKKAIEMWNQFLSFENLNGNLETVSKLELRRAKCYTGMDPSGILSFVQRKCFLDLWPCSSNEIMSFTNDYRISGGAGCDPKGEEGSMQDEDQVDANDTDGISSSNDNNAMLQDNAIHQNKQPTHGITMPDLNQLDLHSRSSSSSTLNVRLTDFMQCLPKTWHGVEIDVNRLIQSIRDNQLEVDPDIFGAAPVIQTEQYDNNQETFTQMKSREAADSDIYHLRAKKVARTIPVE